MKETLRIVIALWAVVALALSGCDTDDGGGSSADVVADTGGQGEVSLELTFVDPPVDLGDIGAQFAEDIAYDEYDDTVFDIFLVESETPTPLIVYIHGGGFTGGDKGGVYDGDGVARIQSALEAGVSFATINYRLLVSPDPDGIIKSLTDSRRCLQFLRYHADALNVDKERVAVYGGSAGAGTSLWLGFHDEMADPDSDDPVLRESTRVKAAGAIETQATYDLRKWESLVLVDYGITIDLILSAKPEMERTLLDFYGMESVDEIDSEPIQAYRADVDMLALMSTDDPPFWVKNENEDEAIPLETGALYHHPYHARELVEQAEAIGHPYMAYIPKLGVEDPSGDTVIDFLLNYL